MMPLSQLASTQGSGLRTLADLLAELERHGGLDSRRRAQISGAVNTICAVLERSPETVPAEPGEIDRMLCDVPRAIHGRSAKTLQNVKSQIRTALHYCAHARAGPPRGTQLSPEWALLYSRLPTAAMRNGLSRFVRVASFRGVPPENVDDDYLQGFLAALNESRGRHATTLWRTTVHLWNQAVATVEGWPQRSLAAPAPTTRIRHLSLDAFPQSLQTEIQAHLEWAGRDELADNAPPRSLKATTRRLRQEQLRIAASILAGEIDGPQNVTGLDVLVQPAHVKIVLAKLRDRTPDRRASAFTRGMAVALSTVARHWCKRPAGELEELRRVRRTLGRESTGLTAKNRMVLRQLEDSRTLGALLALPESLLRDVKTRRMSPRRRLQKMEIAVAISLLQIAPMRLQNLAGLRLDRHLTWPAGRSGAAYITFADIEVKNEEALDYPINGQARELLHTYLDRYRRIAIDSQESPWLFVRPDGKQMTPAALRDGISKAIKRATGLRMSPHMFRHLAAMLYLDAHPGALGDVKDFLGHCSVRTTERFYAGNRRRQAALEFDRIVERARTQAR